MVSDNSHCMYNSSVPLQYGQDNWMYWGCSWSCVLFSGFVISTSKFNKAKVACMTVSWRYKELDLSCSHVQRRLVTGHVGTLTLLLCSHHGEPQTSCRHLYHLMLLVDCRWSQLHVQYISFKKGVFICKEFIMEKMSLIVLQKQITCLYKENMQNCVFFSHEEAWYALSSNVMSQHYKYWYSKNPHLIHEIPVHDLKIKARCSVYECKIIGGMILKERNSDCYTQLIQNQSSGN